MVLSRGSLRLALPDSTISRPSLSCFTASTTPSDSSWTTGGISFADLDKLQVLGSGNGGTVYKVRHRITSEIYAMKIVRGDTDPTVTRQLRREIEILRLTTDCHNVVRCHGVIERSSGDVAILMEFMDLGSLESLRGKVSELQIAGIARQILNGFCYLRSKKILHRDIKPANLLINSDNVVKIADFGISKIMVPSLDPCNTFVGTCAYMSPERFDPDSFLDNDSRDYDVYSTDIWSFGLTMLELYVGRFPLLQPEQRADWPTVMCAICFTDPPRAPKEASEAFRSFIDCCLQQDWRKRWTASQLLEHPFVQQDPRPILDPQFKLL